jgi:cytochrome c oxidase cbb3-type subunit 1
MTVNPKKLRPYDEPPRRRRVWIPERPDSAATGFLVVAALWLAVAGGLGVLAIGMRIVSGIEFSFPLLFGFGFTFDAPRVDYAFVNALVYGWLSNAGLAAVCFIAPRLVGRPQAMEKGANVALAVWNLSIAGGIALLYVLDPGPNLPLTAFPFWIEGGMALALLIMTAAFFATVARDLRVGYISTWYMAFALLGLLGLTGINATLGLVEAVGLLAIPDTLAALMSAYDSRAIETLWLLGMAIAVLYYVIPRGSDAPLASGGLAVLGLLTWLVLAPIAPVAGAVDRSVPYAITTIGIVAAVLLVVPVFLVVTNLLLTLRGRWTSLFGAGTVAFAAVSLAFLLGTALLDAIGALRAVRAVVGGTQWEVGAFLWATLGAFTFAMLALAEHAMPRLLRRAWGGGLLSAAQLWSGFAGATLAGLALMGGGLAEGSMRASAAPPDLIADALLGYRALALAGIGLSALTGVALLINLFLMYTSGEPVRPAPSQHPAASAAAAGH